jgi:hypothetical protein
VAVAHHWRKLDRLTDSEVRAMAKGRDRPKKEPKRKAKEKAPKNQPGSIGAAGAAGPVVPSYQPPTRSVELIKPKRKEREPEPQDEE